MKTYIATSVLLVAMVISVNESAIAQTEDTLPEVSPGEIGEITLDSVNARDALSYAQYQGFPDQPLLAQNTTSTYGTTGSKEKVSPVVIQFSPVKAGVMEMLLEDLTIMTHIIEKALDGGLGEPNVPEKMGVRMLLTGSGRSVRSMYVEGLGPMFMIKVNFPLLPPPKVETKTEASTGSEWDKARKELSGTMGTADETGLRRAAAAEYNEEQVETLKSTLLTVLKQAVNIRSLKPDDFVAVSVFGSDGAGSLVGIRAVTGFSSGTMPRGGSRTGIGPGRGSRSGVSSMRSKADAGAGVEARETQAPALSPGGQPIAPATATSAAPSDSNNKLSRGEVVTNTIIDTRTGKPIRIASIVPSYSVGGGTVLTIRVRKADVDAFATDEFDLKTFQGRAIINAYAGAGYEVTSLNSWLRR